jgi:hypothetical protein
MEIIETGALRRVDAERTEDVVVVQLFQGIYGVGVFVLDLASHHIFIARIGPSRTIDRICLVFFWLPHSRRHQGKKGGNQAVQRSRNRIEVL